MKICKQLDMDQNSNSKIVSKSCKCLTYKLNICFKISSFQSIAGSSIDSNLQSVDIDNSIEIVDSIISVPIENRDFAAYVSSGSFRRQTQNEAPEPLLQVNPTTVQKSKRISVRRPRSRSSSRVRSRSRSIKKNSKKSSDKKNEK